MHWHDCRLFQSFTRYQNKISFIAFSSVLVSLLLMILVSYSGINALYDRTSDEMEQGLREVTRDYITNYMNISSDYIDSHIRTFFAEQATLAAIYQTALDTDDALGSSLPSSPLFRTTLSSNGRWQQNPPTEISSVLVARYMENSDRQIKPEVQSVIRNSAMLNLLMPAFYNHGATKLWLYYVGPKNEEILRTVPWNDSGSAMDRVYPAFTDSPIWEAFSPGLVAAWERKLQDPSFDRSRLSELAIMKPPSQDGFTGKSILTLNHPIWDRQRNHFLGSISVDVELAEIIDYASNIKLAQHGFAFVSQSNGNIFAINPAGEEILGLRSTQDSTVQRKSGAEYNPMLRFFRDSSYDAVKNLQLATSPEIIQQELQINGVDYIVFQKNMKPVRTWNREKGLHEDAWVLGFVIPKQELYATYHTVRQQVKDSGRQIIFHQCIIVSLIIALAALIINFAASRMTRDLTQLQEAASAIARADYDAPLAVASQDEIGSLAVTVDHMRHRIKQSFGELTEKNAALAGANFQLSQLSERYAQLIEIMAYMMESGSQDEEAFFNGLLNSAKRLVPEADYGSITLFDNGSWRYMATIGHDKDGLNELRLPYSALTQFQTITLIEDGDAAIRNRLPKNLWPRFQRHIKPTAQLLFAPLKIGDELVGNLALDIGKDSSSRFSPESIKAMTALSNVAAAFISLNRYALRLAKLHEIDSAILANQTLQEIATAALNHLGSLIPCQRASCAVVAPNSTHLSILAVRSDYPSALAPGYTFSITPAWLAYLQTAAIVIIDDIAQADATLATEDRILLDEGFRSHLRVPLELDGALLGSLNFSSLSSHAFNTNHAALAREVAASLTIALQQARLQEQIQTYNAELERRVQELENKNAEMERFTYTVSHDLKSPLITIKGFLGMLVNDAKSGKLDRMESDIRRITNAADKMQHLLEDLLELSRIGRIVNPASSFPMSDACREAAELLHGVFDKKNIQLTISGDMPSVSGDRIRIREVWQNLLENAAKYIGDQPEPHIEAGWSNGDIEPVFFVADNGIGIEPPYQSKIFGLFDKLDPHSEGTGIGLALVKRIIELHHGRIWVESRGEGQGSTFYFTLPRKEA